MPGVSSHFDHTLGLSVMGQQVLTWDIFMSKVQFLWIAIFLSAILKNKV